MSADWAALFSYQWWSDIGVPALGALGSIAVGGGAIAVGWSSNRVASAIANREHELQTRRDAAEERDNRAAFGTLVSRWSDRLIEEIRGTPMWSGHGASAERSDDLKAEVDARAAALRVEEGQDIVAFVESLHRAVPSGTAPAEYRRMELIVDIRRAYIQSWIDHPKHWQDLDVAARLTSEGWMAAAQFIGRYNSDNEYVARPDVR